MFVWLRSVEVGGRTCELGFRVVALRAGGFEAAEAQGPDTRVGLIGPNVGLMRP